MPEENTSASGETPGAGGSQGETPNTSGTGETPGTKFATLEDALKEIERQSRALTRANAEAKTHREASTELTRLKKQIEDEKLSESERLQKQLTDAVKERDDALKQASSLRIDTAIQLRASQLGFADPDDAIKLLDRSKVADDASNIDALLSDLLKSKPHLKAQGRASSGGATNPGRQASAHEGEITAEFVRTMTAEQYGKLTRAQKDKVQELMRAR